MEASAPFDGLALAGQLDAALRDYGVEGVEVGDVLIDNRLIDGFPEMLGGLKLRRIGRQEEKPYPFGNPEIALAMPTGVIENEDNDAVGTCAGLFGERRQHGFEKRLRNAVGNIPEAFAGGGRNKGRNVEPFEAVMAVGDGANADRRPDATHNRLQTEPVFVCCEGFDGNARMGLRLLGDDFGDFFLKAS